MPVDARSDLREEVRQVLDMTSRIDERVKGLVERQAELYSGLQGQSDKLNGLMSRVTVLETHGGSDLVRRLDDLVRQMALIEATGAGPLREVREQVDDMDKAAVQMEHRVKTLEGTASDWGGKVRGGVAEVLKAVVAIVVAYLLFRFGIKS